MERRTYDKEFKRQAVELSKRNDVTVMQVAQEVRINPKLLYRWRAEAKRDGTEAFPGKGHVKESEEELRRLQRELDWVRTERDILKKALSVFAQPSS